MKTVSISSLVLLFGLSLAAQTTQGPTLFTGATNNQIVRIQQNGSGFGLATSSVSNAPSIYGQATPSTGFTFGLWGDVFSTQGTGVRGESHASTGGAGVVGITHGNTQVLGDGSGVGVHGLAENVPGTQAIGVLGTVTNGLNGVRSIGVMGHVKIGSGRCCATAGLFWNEFSDGGDILVGQTFTAPNVKTVFRVDTFGGVFASAFFTSGADLAESIAVSGNRSGYDPGDILIIDSGAERTLKRTTQPYSTLVAGIYSTKPGVVAGATMDKDTISGVPLAVVGIVPCKVTTRNGAIRPGDLLVTSSKPGYAMKGTDRKRMAGAVLGKALQPLASGEGVVEVLVTLH